MPDLGQDFSERMIELSKEKMPDAKLYQGDFSKGLVRELMQNRYDAIIATYSLHHLSDKQKIMQSFPQMKYEPFSFCAGLLSLKR